MISFLFAILFLVNIAGGFTFDITINTLSYPSDSENIMLPHKTIWTALLLTKYHWVWFKNAQRTILPCVFINFCSSEVTSVTVETKSDAPKMTKELYQANLDYWKLIAQSKTALVAKSSCSCDNVCGCLFCDSICAACRIVCG